MNKLYIIILVVLLVAGGAWFVMRKSALQPSLSGTSQPTSTSADQGNTLSTIVPSQSVSATNQITLTVSSPTNNSTVTSATVSVRGKTLPNADVFVNDAETKADASGNFVASVTLDEGENPIVIVVNDTNGNSAEAELMITYNAG